MASTRDSADVLLGVLLNANASDAAQGNNECHIVWRSVFGTGAESAYIRRLYDLIDLADELRQDLLATGLRPSAFDAPLKAFEVGTWTSNFNAPWGSYWAAIDGPVTMQTLELTAGLLAARPEDARAQVFENVEGLRDELARIYAAVVGSDDLPREVKHLVQKHLHDMIDALERYDTRTTSAFMRVVEAFAGLVGLDRPLREALMRSPVGRVVLIALLSSWVATGHTVPELAAPPAHTDEAAATVEHDNSLMRGQLNQTIVVCITGPDRARALGVGDAVDSGDGQSDDGSGDGTVQP